MQIGSVKYDKQEEKTWVKSFLLSIFTGIPLGITISYLSGFLMLLKQLPYSNVQEIAIVDFLSFGSIIVWWWLSMISFSLLLYWRSHKISHLNDVGRYLFSSLIIPFIWIYITPIMAIIVTPLNRFLLQYYDPVSVFWYGALVFFPFMLLFVYIVVPDLRPRIRHNLRMVFTRRYWGKAWRTPKSRWKILLFSVFFAFIIAEFLWKILQR